MKKEKNKKLNTSERGITLIALIVTIIILIILVSVTIKAIAGDNLISTAEEAATNYLDAESTEEDMFKSMSVIMESIPIAGLSEENVIVTKTPEDWTNGIVKTAIQTSVEGYTLEYSKDLTTWYTYTEEIESSENETIYARLTNGNGIGGYIEIPITNIDKSVPNGANIELSGAGTVTSNPTLKATITHSDEGSGINVENCKYVLNTTSGAIGTDVASYTGGTFTNNGEELSFPMSTGGTYYLHILSVDYVGLACESISMPITLTENVHEHAGSTSSGGGCYTESETISKTCGCSYTLACTEEPYFSYVDESNGHDIYRATYGGTCPSCGNYNTVRYKGRSAGGYGGSYTISCPQSVTITVYSLSCGLDEGQIISYTITY